MNIPKIVHVVVKGGQYLKYNSGGSRKLHLPHKKDKDGNKAFEWRVIFIGGAQKQATAVVEERSGCPTWDSQATIDVINPLDPVILRVVDGNAHEIGEVRIPLNSIQFATDPTTDVSKMYRSELMATKKNKAPQGALCFWIWTTEFWPANTQLNKFKPKHKKKDKLDDCASSIFSGVGGGGGRASSTFGSTLRVPGGSYNPMDDDAGSSAFQQTNPQMNGRLGGPTGLPPMHHQSQLNIPYAQSECGSGMDTIKRAGSHLGVNNPNRNMLQTMANIAHDVPQVDNLFKVMAQHDETERHTPVRTDGVGEPGPFDSPNSGSHRGMHAEEKPNKAVEDMSKREAAEYANQLQKTLNSVRSENTRLQNEQQRLQEELNEKEEELNTVRLSLAMLKGRLLEDNLTQYLEVSPNTMMNGFGGGLGLSGFGGTAAVGMNSYDDHMYNDPYQSYSRSPMMGGGMMSKQTPTSGYGGGGGGGANKGFPNKSTIPQQPQSTVGTSWW